MSKEIDDKFMVIAADFSTVQKTAEEMREKLTEEAEKLKKKK